MADSLSTMRGEFASFIHLLMPDNWYEGTAAGKGVWWGVLYAKEYYGEEYAKEHGKEVKEDRWSGSDSNQEIFNQLSSNIQNQNPKNTGHSYLSKASFYLNKGYTYACLKSISGYISTLTSGVFTF